jgi:hypothetical protein
MTERWLAQVKLFGSASDVSLTHEHLEDQQQIQIKVAERPHSASLFMQ